MYLFTFIYKGFKDILNNCMHGKILKKKHKKTLAAKVLKVFHWVFALCS